MDSQIKLRIEYPNATFYYAGAQVGAIHLLDNGTCPSIEHVDINHELVPPEIIVRVQTLLVNKWESDKAYER